MKRPKNKADRVRKGKLKAKRRTWWARIPWSPTFTMSMSPAITHLEFSQWQERKHRDTTKKCSNPRCCGNKRKIGERTRQELKADDARKADSA